MSDRLREVAEAYVTSAGVCLERRHGESCNRETLNLYLERFRAALSATEEGR